jgi:dTDP-4-amino-4,6-dideoxygalactose transaminase
MEHNITWRRKIAEIYYDRLKKFPGFHFQKIPDGCETNFCTFALEIDSQEFGLDASVLQECLKEEGIEALRYFCPPMHKTRAYKEFNHLRMEQSEILSQRNLCLPIHAHLTIEQAHIVCDAIERICDYAKKSCKSALQQEADNQQLIRKSKPNS